MSNELKAFYKDYLAWATDQPRNLPFNYFWPHGLCTSLAIFIFKVQQYKFLYPELAELDQDLILEKNLACEMKDQFEKAGLNRDYPFGEAEYYDGKYATKKHKDPKRLAWVKQHAEEN